IDDVVDDVVVANIDAVALGAIARLGVGANIETYDRSARCVREDHVAFGDRAHSRLKNLHAYLVGAELEECTLDRFCRALHISLDNEGKQTFLASFASLEKLVERLTR